MGTLLVATILGAICGAFVIGLVVVGYIWWTNQQKMEAVRYNLNRPQPSGSLETELPPSKYFSNPQEYAPKGSEDMTFAPPSSPPAGVAPGMAWLDGVAGIIAGQRMVLSKEEMLLGRSGVCDMQFHDPKVSRQHAMVRLHDNHYFIQDMQSSRGTFINGKRIQTHQLQDRDQIQLGDTVLVFRRY